MENCNKKYLAMVLSIVRWYIHSRVKIYHCSAALIHITSQWKFVFFFLIGDFLIMRMDD